MKLATKKYFCPANLGENYVICLHMTDHAGPFLTQFWCCKTALQTPKKWVTKAGGAGWRGLHLVYAYCSCLVMTWV